MRTPTAHFTNLYETLTREKRHRTDSPRRRNGLAASQAQRRIYIYIYTLWASATDITKAHKRACTTPNIDLLPRRGRAPRLPCGSRPARDAGQQTRARHAVTTQSTQTAESPRVTLKSSAKLLRCYMTAEASPCYKTDISKM